MSMGLRLPTSPSSRPPSSDAGAAGPARKTRGVLALAVRLLLALLGALAGYQIAESLRASSYAPDLGRPGKLVWKPAFTGAAVVVGIGGVPIHLLSGYVTASLAAKQHVEILRLRGLRGALAALPALTPPSFSTRG